MCNERVCCNLFRRERVERFLCASWRFPPSFLDLPFVSASLRFAATRSWFLSVLPRLLPFVLPERGPYVVAVLGSRSFRIR